MPKPAEGSWTAHYPDLGFGPVPTEDSISPEFYELEREAVFKRAWLNVGRVDLLPRMGSYFTKELAVANTSLIVVRDRNEQVRAFHNVCRHRGNKLVWNDFPREETRGVCRQFTCKYHGWRFDLDGALNFVQQEEEFFDLDKNDYGLAPVHCEVWEGFIFVNLAKRPAQTLHEFLGPMVLALEGYPFDKLTERWSYRAEIGSNWKIFLDAFQEFYHAPVLHASQSPSAFSVPWQQAGFEAPFYAIEGPHRVVSTSGIRPWELGVDQLKPMEITTRSGLFGPWDAPDLGVEKMPPGVNPGGADPWGLDSYQIWPNFVVIVWKQNWVLTYHYWPTAYNRHAFEGNAYFVPAETAEEFVAHEMTTLSFKEYALQDANTCEATQIMLESRAFDSYPLGDQEVLCRHLHKLSREAVAECREEFAGR